MKIQKILDYQVKDSEIIKIEKDLAQSKNKKALMQIVDVVKQAQQISATCEAQAQEVLNQFNSLKKAYDDNIKTFLNIQNKDVEKLEENDANDIMKATNDLFSNLNILEKKLLSQAEKINSILNDYENAKKRYNLAREKHTFFKEQFENEQNKAEPQIEKLKKELGELSKNVDSELLKKYLEKRGDKIFPVFVPVINNACGGCMMELPMAQTDKLKRDGLLECENCQRIIYKNNN